MYKCDGKDCIKPVDNDGELCDGCITFMLDAMSEEDIYNRIAEAFGEVVDRTGW